ncbi:MAG: radical SAM protein [Rhodobacteraceae bacterium]|nr:radical SAM protein [Paracoccaceae bacterium]
MLDPRLSDASGAPEQKAGAAPKKWRNPAVTAQGERRAVAPLSRAETLWFNTGTLCNIECAHCYIESSPLNDRLVYITRAEVAEYLDQAAARGWPLREVGLTGGEPFMNPEIIGILEEALGRGLEVLVLTNAMKPLMRPRVMAGMQKLHPRYGDKLTLRVSLDHYTAAKHDAERGAGAFEDSLLGMRWLNANGFRLAVAGRTLWDEAEAEARTGFAALYASEGFAIDAHNPMETVLFPEMDETIEVPEITEACWGILGKSPEDVMCATARMVVKRKGAAHPTVLACTLLPYSPEFELGKTLAEAEAPVALNHPHCAKFCVLGGASCSG